MSDVIATDGVQRRRFSIEEYYRMAEVGIFGPEERVELQEPWITIAPRRPVKGATGTRGSRSTRS